MTIMNKDECLGELINKFKDLEDDHLWELDSLGLDAQKSWDLLIDVVDSYHEKYNNDTKVEMYLKQENNLFDPLSCMDLRTGGIKEEFRECHFVLKLIANQYKAEAFDKYFEDTHGQKCLVDSNNEVFRLGVYNTGRMIDFDKQSKPPWMDEYRNQDVDKIMKLDRNGAIILKRSLEYFVEEEYVESEMRDENHDYVLYDSSVATYAGLWLGVKNQAMHLDIPKVKRIIEHLEIFISRN